MKLQSTTFGIVSEFNPFHEGHAFLNRSLKQAYGDETVTIAIMSSNFVQRGEIAFLDRYERAKKAVEGGYNLVVGLPLVFSCSSAGSFARGAIAIAKMLELDGIAFGAEGDSKQVNFIRFISSIYKANSFAIEREAALMVSEGFSYPIARTKAIVKFLKKNNVYDYADYDLKCDEKSIIKLLSSSNNILALEYLINWDKDFFSVQRADGDHHNSAKLIRKSFFEKNPKEQKNREKIIYTLLCTRLLAPDNHWLKKYSKRDMDLIMSLQRACIKTNSINELISSVKNKTYTYSRIERLITQIILGYSQRESDMWSKYPPYIQLLAMDSKGMEFLNGRKKQFKDKGIIFIQPFSKAYKQISKAAENNYNSEEDLKSLAIEDVYKRWLDIEIYGSHIFNMVCGKLPLNMHNEKVKKIFISNKVEL